MVDGKRSAGALRKFAASFGNVNVLLRELFEAGLIELDPAYVEKILVAQAEIAQESKYLPSVAVAETVVATSGRGPTSMLGGTAGSAATPQPPRDIRHDLRNLGAPDPITQTNTLSPNTITRSPLTGNTAMRSPLAANTATRTPLGSNTVTRSPLNSNTATLALSLAPIDESLEASITYASDAALADARKFATQFVFNALGNSGTALCFAIERTETLKGLLETTAIARKTLRAMKGDATADAFQSELRKALSQ
jgi:hypothetical protein